MSRFTSLKSSIINNAHKYAIFNPHTLPPIVREGINKNKIIAIFIDPAVKTCALRVSQKDLNTGLITTKLQTLLDFRCQENDFATDGTSYYSNCISMLDEYLDYFINSHYIVIEHQYCSVASYNVIRIEQQLITYLLMVTKDKGKRPLILEIDPKLKTTMMGVNTNRKLKKEGKTLKKETTKLALNILRERGEEDSADTIEKLSKKDDHGDTICYDYMFWIILERDSEMLNLIKEKKSRLKF